MARPEPHLGETVAVAIESPPSRDAVPRIAEGAACAQVPSNQASIRRLAIVAVLTGIFSFGAALGLFATAWVKKNPQHAALIAAVISGTGIHPQLAKWTRESGAEQPVEVTAVEAPLVASTPSEIDAPRPDVPQAPESHTDTQESDAIPRAFASTGAADQSAAPAPSPADTVVANAPPRPVPNAARSAKPRYKGGTAKQTQIDPEIERIKRQAGDELTNKTSSSATPKKSGASQKRKYTIASVVHLNKRALVAQCEQEPNFMVRERCKWNLCNGTWGRDGCPSYDKPRGLF